MKTPQPSMRRLLLILPEDVIRTLKSRAALEALHPRDLITAWVRSWAKPDMPRPGGRR
jgi:hypothetical protein